MPDIGLIGIDNVQDECVSSLLEQNIISFFDWGFLDKGGYVNVNRPTYNIYNSSKHILKPVDDPRYTNGTVWQAFRQNWVWETGVNRPTQPNLFSGVYVGSNFLPYTYNPSSGKYIGSGYKVDFPNGKILFDNVIPPTSVVSADYSYKWVSVNTDRGHPFFKYIQQNSFRPDQNFYTGSGNWIQLGEARVQLPAIFIDSPYRVSSQGLQLGGGQYRNGDVIVHILTEKYNVAKNIPDIITYQGDRVINLYDVNGVYKSGQVALDHDGSLIDRSYDYRYAIQNHFYGKCFINKATSENPLQLSPTLFYSTARFSTQIEISSLS